jgi:aminopeptidase-like protein
MNIKKYYNIGKNQLYPLNRSLTGEGSRKTLSIIKKYFSNFNIKSSNSGKKCFDWKIPNEWIIKNAFVKDNKNKKIINFKNHNLHVVGYSSPVNKIINKKQLLSRLHTLPKQKNAIPYITSYYKKYWGFCSTHNLKNKIIKNYDSKAKFKILIESKFNNRGKLHYGDYTIKGNQKNLILISTNICHPSMANNELSGPILSMALMDFFSKRKNKKTIKFIFIPETIGAINFISKENEYLKKYLDGGYILSCIGDEKMYSCIFSKYKNSLSDKALRETYKKLKIRYKEYSFLKRGSDERQFNSPGVDLPVTAVFRSKHSTFKEYHTSLDDFNLVTRKAIYESFNLMKKTIINLDDKIIPRMKTKCEPFMSKYNLYATLSTKKKHKFDPIMDFLQFCDGKNDIDQIAIKIKLSKLKTKNIYNILLAKKIIY